LYKIEVGGYDNQVTLNIPEYRLCQYLDKNNTSKSLVYFCLVKEIKLKYVAIQRLGNLDVALYFKTLLNIY